MTTVYVGPETDSSIALGQLGTFPFFNGLSFLPPLLDSNLEQGEASQATKPTV